MQYNNYASGRNLAAPKAVTLNPVRTEPRNTDANIVTLRSVPQYHADIPRIEDPDIHRVAVLGYD